MTLILQEPKYVAPHKWTLINMHVMSKAKELLNNMNYISVLNYGDIWEIIKRQIG